MSADSAWVVLPFAAFFGAACAAFFNWSLQTFARKQVVRDRVVADKFLLFGEFLSPNLENARKRGIIPLL